MGLIDLILQYLKLPEIQSIAILSNVIAVRCIKVAYIMITRVLEHLKNGQSQSTSKSQRFPKKIKTFWIILKKSLSILQGMKMVSCLYMKHSQKRAKRVGIGIGLVLIICA